MTSVSLTVANWPLRSVRSRIVNDCPNVGANPLLKLSTNSPSIVAAPFTTAGCTQDPAVDPPTATSSVQARSMCKTRLLSRAASTGEYAAGVRWTLAFKVPLPSSGTAVDRDRAALEYAAAEHRAAGRLGVTIRLRLAPEPTVTIPALTHYPG